MGAKVEFEGRTYHWGRSGGGYYYYYHSHRDGTHYLHRDIWESANGPIPEGHDIHHIDGNTLNWHIENLRCLPHGKHAHLHRNAQKNNPFQRTCAFCGAPFHSVAPQAKYCSERCAHQDCYRNGWSAILDYAKGYRDSHKDKIKVTQEAYYKKNKDALTAKARERYAANRDKNIAKARAYRAEHKDEINARRRLKHDQGQHTSLL